MTAAQLRQITSLQGFLTTHRTKQPKTVGPTVPFVSLIKPHTVHTAVCTYYRETVSFLYVAVVGEIVIFCVQLVGLDL